MKLNLKHTFTKELPADSVLENYRRQVKEACYSYVTPKQTKAPELIHVSNEMAQTLGIKEAEPLK